MIKKITLVLFILFVFICSNIYAIDFFSTSQDSNEEKIVTENEEDSSDFIETIGAYEATTYYNDESVSENKLLSTTSSTLSEPTSSVPTITTTVAQDNTLSISDIINIILIAVCVVLIFLAIAILIRCK